MPNDSQILALFDPLWGDIDSDNTFPNKRPLLAHYTAIETMESILKNDEVWLSHPLCINDLEELRFGISESTAAFHNHHGIRKACKTAERHEALTSSYRHYLSRYESEHAFDVYIFCLSEHPADDEDGLLSMWRGYGANGNGAAIVFDTSKLNHEEGSPLLIAKVIYASAKDRIARITSYLDIFSSTLEKHEIPDEKLYLAAHAIFERMKIFSLFTKHSGFHEENEWRVVYMKERETDNKLAKMLHYFVSPNGIQPKLKLKIRPDEGIIAPGQSLEKLIHKIVLGPSLASPLTSSAVRRMLKLVGKERLTEKISVSSTPFRATR